MYDELRNDTGNEQQDMSVGHIEEVSDVKAEEIPVVQTETTSVAEKTESDYINEISRLQEEYKQYQKAKREALEKQRKEEEARKAANEKGNRRGLNSGITILISCGASIMIFVLLFAILAFFPSKQKSILAQFFGGDTIINQNTTINGMPGDSNDIGGTTVNPGDNVTITVESDSVAAAVYAKASNSVVGIQVTQVSGGAWNQTETIVSQGSGIIYSSDGIIVTNYHVVSNAINTKTGKLNTSYNIYAFFDKKLTQYTSSVTLIGYDVSSDIAVLKFSITGLTPLEFADSDAVTIGEHAVAIGCPGGLDFMNSVSEGIISGTDRALATSTEVVYDLLQTTAAINPGNSGGALLNSEGKLLGICVMKIADESYEGMGFAISSNTVKRIVESIQKYGFYNKPQLGVTVDTTYNMSMAQANGWPLGAAVTDVAEGSCADKAGIKKNDIITAINGVKVETFIDLRSELLKYSPGETITIELFRTGIESTKVVNVTLAAANSQ